jgi:hypothetical protein
MIWARDIPHRTSLQFPVLQRTPSRGGASNKKTKKPGPSIQLHSLCITGNCQLVRVPRPRARAEPGPRQNQNSHKSDCLGSWMGLTPRYGPHGVATGVSDAPPAAFCTRSSQVLARATYAYRFFARLYGHRGSFTGARQLVGHKGGVFKRLFDRNLNFMAHRHTRLGRIWWPEATRLQDPLDISTAMWTPKSSGERDGVLNLV